MAVSNHERVGKSLEVLLEGFRPYVARELKAHYGANWFARSVSPNLTGTVGLDANRKQGSDDEKFSLLDVQALLSIVWSEWNQTFQVKLGHTGRTYVSEIRDVRNKWAHQQPFTIEDCHRALDTIGRLLQMVSSPQAEVVHKMARELLRIRYEEEAKREVKKGAQISTETGTPVGLKPWREIATPHPDVASGRYQQAEFAADLAQVDAKEAEDEYQNPIEFFRRTYLTEGLSHLLSLALQRLSGAGGDPVVELQTNFGGGKTHSMLALYHLFGGAVKPGQVAGLEKLLDAANAKSLPVAKVAVLVGTRINPATPQRKPDGTEVRTLWGDLAYQLGAKDGYKLVAEADKKGVNPGSDTLKSLFDKCGPCLILIDEWVAFARQLYNVDDLPAGSFDSNMTFAQALTEAARRTKTTLVVASIPASDIEIGGEGGRAALDRLRNTFGRMEAVWKPASAEESFEIVRRRLFQSMTDFAARDAVCHEFAQMYRQNRGEFPRECAESDYDRRLKAAYPIHPELFDRLYQDWSTLQRFQRTRGVLRLMAAVIHELWERQDKSLLIMPGTMPLDCPPVRFEMTRYLSDGWGAVIDTDIDGATSRPLSLDRDNPNLGRYSAARRVTRTIFVGSAPSSADQRVRGIEEVRVKLGCVQPGEVPATFGDSLRKLSDQLSYLYGDGSRYWFDTRPSVNRLAADRAEQYRAEDIFDEIVRRLKSNRQIGEFAGVHIAPNTNQDVPDVQETRLVILSPSYPHSSKLNPSAATEECNKILEFRGTANRVNRNCLIFLAADKERLVDLERSIRQAMAWQSIDKERDRLDLGIFQQQQLDSSLKRAEETVHVRLQETYCWLIAPTQEGTSPITLEISRISGTDEYVGRVSRKLKGTGQLVQQWSPALLKIELDKWFWEGGNHVSLKAIMESFFRYCYLPRLVDTEVLLNAIREGLSSNDYFGYATSVDADGKYAGLKIGATISTIHVDEESVLVKAESALKQIQDELTKQSFVGTGAVSSAVKKRIEVGSDGAKVEQLVIPKAPEIRRFHGTVSLNPTRLGRDAGEIGEAILQHIAGLNGVRIDVTLEIHAELEDGAPDQVVKTVSENCKTLKFLSFGFEKE